MPYILRHVDPLLWSTVKACAARDGRPLRWILVRLLTLYADGRIDLATLEED